MSPFLPLFLALPGCAPGAVLDEPGHAVAAEATASANPESVRPAPLGCTELAGGVYTVDAPYLAQEADLEGLRRQCQVPVHPLAGASGQTLRLTLTHWDAPSAPQVQVVDLLGDSVAPSQPLAPGETLTLVLPSTGEHFLRLDPADPAGPSHTYGLALRCFDGCERAYTRYPLVLMHGAGGADAFLDVLTYFYDVPETLMDLGYAVAWPAVDPVAGYADRAAQWQGHLDQLHAEGVGRRFNLIAHSQGGVDARYLASGLADERVVSVTTISTPHHGTPVADVALGLVTGLGLDSWQVDLALAELGGWLGVGELAALDQLADLSTDGMAAFNLAHPDVPGVWYTSWAGHSCDWLDWDCQGDQGGEVVTPFLATSHWINSLVAGANDGMVPVSSAVWGDYLGEFSADHFDEVGQIAGAVEAFDHRAFYVGEAQRLFERGL